MFTSDSRDAGPEGESPTTRATTGLRAMVIEDERELADLIGTYLTREGLGVSDGLCELIRRRNHERYGC
jgi:hypothetical protein